MVPNPQLISCIWNFCFQNTIVQGWKINFCIKTASFIGAGTMISFIIYQVYFVKCCQVFLTSKLEEGKFEVYFCRAFLNLNKEPPKIGHFCHFSNHHTASWEIHLPKAFSYTHCTDAHICYVNMGVKTNSFLAKIKILFENFPHYYYVTILYFWSM